MPIISLPGTSEGYAAGNNAGNYLAKAADAAADFACGLYKNYPGAVVGNAADSAIRGLWDGLCANRSPGLPAPPSSPASGGQCKCIDYLVTYTQYSPSGSEQGSSVLTGPLSFGEAPNPSVPGAVFQTIGFSIECIDGEPGGRGSLSYGLKTAEGDYYAQIDSVSRVDGQPDNCGNAPPSYPPGTNVLPPGAGSGTGTITYNDGTDLTVPLVYAPISPQFSLNPRFNVDVGGIKVQFDLGGVKIDLGNENSNPALPRDPFNDCSDDLDRIGRAIDDLDDKVDALEPGGNGGGNTPDNPPPPPAATPPDDDPDLDKDPKSENDPKEENGIERLKWVKIILTKVPDKVQFGDGAPNCYFAGWFEFKAGVACYPREQINFQTSLFLAPAGADGYAYTLTNGAEGYAVVYKRKE